MKYWEFLLNLKYFINNLSKTSLKITILLILILKTPWLYKILIMKILKINNNKVISIYDNSKLIKKLANLRTVKR